MKIQWDSNLKYKMDIVNSVIDLFIGQNRIFKYFSIPENLSVSTGTGNKLDISNEWILYNLNYVQAYNKLPASEKLEKLIFDIQIEKETEKTYIYLKTIFELNKHYGFTKFVIVVLDKPQINHIINSIEDTKEHFKELYDKVPYDYFIYDSSNLEKIRDFAYNSNIEIMIINMDNFNSNNNIIYRQHEKLRGNKPIHFISETNPIVIFDKTPIINSKSENAISIFNPLFILNYFHESQNIHNLIYKYGKKYPEMELKSFKMEDKCENKIPQKSILKQMNSVLDEIKKGHSRKESSEITGIPLKRIVNWIIEGRNHYDENKTYFYNQLISIEKNKKNKKLYCRFCNKTFENNDYNYCPICSRSLADLTEIINLITERVNFANECYSHCSNCDKNFQKDFKFCPYCGISLKKRYKFEIDLNKCIVKTKWNNNIISESFFNIYEESLILADPPIIDFFRVVNVKEDWDLKLDEDSKNLSKKPTKLTFNQVKKLESFVNFYRYDGYQFNDKCKFMDLDLIKNTYPNEFLEFYDGELSLNDLLSNFRNYNIIFDFIQVKNGKYKLFYVLDKSIKNKYG